MNIQQLYTCFGLILFLSINHIYADLTKTSVDFPRYKSEQTEQEVFNTLLTAIEEEDLETIDTCLETYPLHLNHLFEKELFLYPSNSAERQPCVINSLIFAIALGKTNSIQALIKHGAEINQPIYHRLPLTFTINIPHKEVRHEITEMLLKMGAIGHTPTDLKKCIKIINRLCKDEKIKNHPQKIITHPDFQDVLEILQKNPHVLFYTITNKVQKHQDLNTVFTATQVDNLLKTAILLDAPWLVSFFITLKKMLCPDVNSVNQQISEHFNLIDYLLHHYNEEILDIFLKENPVISDYFMFESQDLEYKNVGDYYDLYINQNPDKTDFLENLSDPCQSKKLLLTPSYSEETKTFELEILEPETETTLLNLFKTLENEEESLDEDEQIETIQTLLKNIKNPTHLNVKQITIDYCLTDTGYTAIESYETLLNLAINQQNITLVKLLVEAGADINQSLTAQTNHAQLYPITTLYYAAVEGNSETISYLLDKGAIITPMLRKDLAYFKEENRTILEEYINKKEGCDQIQKASVEPVSYKRNREVDTPTLLSPATKRIREN